MKKLLLLSFIILAGCSYNEEVEIPATYTPQYTTNYTTTYNSCNSCRGETRTVSEPVEIVYKNTVYETVYEPKTYTTVNYTREPYTECSHNSLCR